MSVRAPSGSRALPGLTGGARRPWRAPHGSGLLTWLRATVLCLWFVLSSSGAEAAVAIGGHFSLNRLDGEAVTERSFAGKWQLIYFGFTLCPETCPTVMSEVTGALRDLGPLSQQVQPVFITIDPERDTPEQLKGFLSHFDSRIVGLRGNKQQTTEATSAYRVYIKTRPIEAGSEAYTIEHSSFLFLMKPDGSFARLLQADAGGHKLADTLRHELQ